MFDEEKLADWGLEKMKHYLIVVLQGVQRSSSEQSVPQLVRITLDLLHHNSTPTGELIRRNKILQPGTVNPGLGWLRCCRLALQVPEQRQRQHRGEKSLTNLIASGQDQWYLLSKQLAQGQHKFISEHCHILQTAS